MDGWLKLHRSIIDSAVFKDLEVLKIWIWLLCNASFDTHDTLFCGKVITVHPGQIVTGRKKIAQSTDLNESKVYRALMLLKSLGNIEIKSNTKFSVITIVKWAKYQGDLEIVNSKTTANQQHGNNTATTGQQQGNTTKEIKNCKNGKNDIYNSTGGAKDSFPYSDVISYLNEKSGKNYSAKSEQNRRLIRARFNDGYTLDDFKAVIDNKCADWLGTDYEQYLRPQTLFGTKFDGYLNARKKQEKTKEPDIKLNEAGYPEYDFGFGKYFND